MCAKKRSSIFKSRRMWTIIALLLLIVGYFSYTRWWLPKKTTADVYSLLQNNGYTPNPDFSGLFRPGNIIQITELGTDGKQHPITTPVLFAWADECFPGQVPRTQEFTIPQGTGSSAASLTLSRDVAMRLLPAVSLHSEAVANYSLKLENTRVQAFAKGDLSGSFSSSCVAKLKRAIHAGDEIDWFKLILASVVADAITLQVQWKENSSAEARNQVTGNAKSALAASVVTGNPEKDSGMKVGITNNTSQETTISAKGLIIVGYMARSLQPETTR